MRAQSPPVHTAHPWLIDESSYRREVDNLRRVVRRERSTAQRQQSRGADGWFWVELKWIQHHNMLITSLRKSTERATSSHQSILTWNLLICVFQLFLIDNESLDVWWYSDRSIKVTDEPINQLQSTTSSQTFFVVYSPGVLLQRLHLISSRYMLLAQMLTTVCRSSPHVGNIHAHSRLNKSVATEM